MIEGTLDRRVIKVSLVNQDHWDLRVLKEQRATADQTARQDLLDLWEKRVVLDHLDFKATPAHPDQKVTAVNVADEESADDLAKRDHQAQLETEENPVHRASKESEEKRDFRAR